MTFLGLGFPILAAGFICLIILWIFIKKKVSLILLMVFLLGFKNITSIWAFNIFRNFNFKKNDKALRILSWNVSFFDNNARYDYSAESKRSKMFTYIKSVQADIILMQDFGDYLDEKAYFSNVETLRDSLGYRYVLTSNDYIDLHSYGGVIQGSAIFSKIPFVHTGKTVYKDLAEPESMCYADILFANKRMRFYTTHLVSMNIRPHPGIPEEEGKEKYDLVYRYSKNVTRTIKQFDQLHAREADFIKRILLKNLYPSVMTGDFNSVPSSYVYHKIKGNRQDAFLKKGFGLGHSYYALSKTLRIDYILVDPHFKVLQVITPELYLSDHFPVIADIMWAG